MQLDVRTSMFLISVGSLTISTTLIALSNRYAGHIGRSLTSWGNGLALLGVGFILYALRGHIPDFFSVTLANGFFVWGLFSRYFAIKIIKKHDFDLGIPIAITATLLTFNFVFLYLYNDFVLRSNVNVLIYGAIVIFTALHLFFGVDKEKRVTYWTAGIIMLLTGVILLFRSVLGWMANPAITDLFERNQIQSIALLGTFLGTIVLSVVFSFIAIDEYNSDLFNLATRDPLTGIFNRRMFHELAQNEISRLKRGKKALSLILFDMDHFKTINDRYGHAAGDSVLKETARVVSSVIRAEDVFARYGGEEFCLLLPALSNADALAVAEKLRRRISQISLQLDGGIIMVTASFGVTTMESPDSNLETLSREADKAMYEAKRRGRNQVFML
ncbi:MAG: GGDEF domain-containing protein [Methylococcaceae bacterium]|nr:GGDEF domain-containing protein [Methylococcaceae bacterium]